MEQCHKVRQLGHLRWDSIRNFEGHSNKFLRSSLGELPAVLAPHVPAGEGDEAGRRHEEDLSAVDAGKLGQEPEVEHPGGAQAVAVQAPPRWPGQRLQQEISCLKRWNDRCKMIKNKLLLL